jgi:beta-ribofuranosylaminobenzene 5'-phosphate synthase
VKVAVYAPARIHMGFYNFLTDSIAYGDLGVAIERPRVAVRISNIDEDVFKVVNKSNVDISDCIDRVTRAFDLSGVYIEILDVIPRHVGLGSTTQIMLAIACALSVLRGSSCNVRDLAVKLCRGRDSGVGLAAFEKGGFVVNSGRKVSEEGKVLCPNSPLDLPQLIFRAPVPRKWSFIIFTPKVKKGFDEVSERKAMDTPTQLPRDIQYELYKLVFLHMIPSILRRDIEVFGKALTKLQFTVGEYFSKYQGGVFCCEEAELIINTMLKYNVKGVGQSSWGPSVYGLVEEQGKAIKVATRVLKEVKSKGIEVDYMVVKASNSGAKIIVNE